MGQGAAVGIPGPTGPAGFPGLANRGSLYYTSTGLAGATLNATAEADFGYNGSFISTGRDWIFFLQMTLTIVGGGNIRTMLKVDSVDIKGRFFYTDQAGTMTHLGAVRVPAPSAGSHSYAVRYAVGGNGHTWYNDWAASGNIGDTNRSYIWGFEV